MPSGLDVWSGGRASVLSFARDQGPAIPIDGHYRIDITSSVGHPRSDSVVLLVLCMVACNGWV
jgi:hypothetical protein